MDSETNGPLEVLQDTVARLNDAANQDDLSLPEVPISTFGIRRLEKLTFQLCVIQSVYQMFTYINKVYSDGITTVEYFNRNDIYFCFVSGACLILPPFTYAIYLVGSNLVQDNVLKKSDIGTKIVNGFLLYCWQLKRHLDLLYFSAQRVCHFRPLDSDEKEYKQTLNRNANVLEFFVNLYAGFLQILLQSYLWLNDLEIYSTSRLDTKPNWRAMITSGLSILMLMAHLRRQDDGPLTKILSWLGWPLLIASRILVLSLIATQIHYWIFLIGSVHVFGFSLWVYNIAIESHGISSSSPQTSSAPFANRRKRMSLAVLVTFFFGIPSLFYWPIMFQLKEGRRPIIYLIIIIMENFALLVTWFGFQMHVEPSLTNNQTLLIITVVATTLGGVFFISVYALCKPKYTDQVVRYEIRQESDQVYPTLHKLSDTYNYSSNAHEYGVYFDFCEIVFKLPSTTEIGRKLRQIRSIEIVN